MLAHTFVHTHSCTQHPFHSAPPPPTRPPTRNPPPPLRSVRLWDAATGEPKASLSATPSHCLAYCPTGHLMATGGAEGAVQLWDPTTGVQRSEMRGHRDVVAVLAFSVDGGTLASGSRDKCVGCIWGREGGGANPGRSSATLHVPALQHRQAPGGRRQ